MAVLASLLPPAPPPLGWPAWLQWLLRWRLSRQGELRTYSRSWVRYGELWENFRRRLYWWGSIKELRKLALILVLVAMQVRACDCSREHHQDLRLPARPVQQG